MSSRSRKQIWNPVMIGGLVGPIVLAGLLLAWSMPSPASEVVKPSAPEHHSDISVYKLPRCGCCDKWADQLEDSGLNVDVAIVSDIGPIRQSLGIPRNFASCHSAVAGDYWFEGHVPIDLVGKVLEEQPEDISGIAVPGMPAGSPGMESPNPVTYEVLSVSKTGIIQVFATREGKHAH